MMNPGKKAGVASVCYYSLDLWPSTEIFASHCETIVFPAFSPMGAAEDRRRGGNGVGKLFHGNENLPTTAPRIDRGHARRTSPRFTVNAVVPGIRLWKRMAARLFLDGVHLKMCTTTSARDSLSTAERRS